MFGQWVRHNVDLDVNLDNVSIELIDVYVFKRTLRYKLNIRLLHTNLIDLDLPVHVDLGTVIIFYHGSKNFFLFDSHPPAF